MRQDKKDTLLKNLKESFGFFGMSDSVGDHIFDQVSYNKLRYYNLDFIAAAVFADSDPCKFKEAIELLDKKNTMSNRLSLAGYTQRLSEKRKIYISYEIYTYLISKIPIEVLISTLDISDGKMSFESSLTIEEYLKYSIPLPPENSFMKATNQQRLIKLVEQGWFIPNLDSSKINFNEKKKALIYSAEPYPIVSSVQKKHYFNYMKWAIAVATNWEYFAEIFDELANDQLLIDGILKVANLEVTLKALRRKSITVNELSLLFYSAERSIKFKDIIYSTVTGGLYSRIESYPFSISSKEGVLNCINIANDYSPVIGNVEVEQGTITTENEIQFLFFDSDDEIQVKLGNIVVLLGINEGLVVTGTVEVSADVNYLVIT